MAERVAAGDTVAGWKIGATSGPVRALLGTDEPFYGVLFTANRLSPGATIDVSHLAGPLLECEVAFELGAEVRGPGVGVRQVVAATRHLHAAFELLGRPPSPSAAHGSREDGGESAADDGPPSLVDIIAGNGSSAGFMVAASGSTPEDVDLAGIHVELRRDAVSVARGRAVAVMGDPCRAVAWLANKLAEEGGLLRAGEIVLAGSMTPPMAVRPGDTFRADFGVLGALSMSAAPSPRRAIIPSSTLNGGASA